MKRALFLRWSNLGAYIHDPLYVRCTRRGALNLARVRRNVLSGDRYYRRFGDVGTRVERGRVFGKGHELPRCRSRLGLHSRAARENESVERGAYDFDRSITSATVLPPEDAALSLPLSSRRCTRSLPKRRAFLSAPGLSGGGFVLAGDKHRLRAKCARSRLLEIAQAAHPSPPSLHAFICDVDRSDRFERPHDFPVADQTDLMENEVRRWIALTLGKCSEPLSQIGRAHV